MLRVRLVCGINNGCIQHRLLAKSTLTYEKALEIEQAMELANRDAKNLHANRNSPHEQVHKVYHGCSKSPSLHKTTRASIPRAIATNVEESIRRPSANLSRKNAMCAES